MVTGTEDACHIFCRSSIVDFRTLNIESEDGRFFHCILRQRMLNISDKLTLAKKDITMTGGSLITDLYSEMSVSSWQEVFTRYNTNSFISKSI